MANNAPNAQVYWELKMKYGVVLRVVRKSCAVGANSNCNDLPYSSANLFEYRLYHRPS